MGKFAVIQAQYEAVTGSNPAHLKGVNRPVEQVSWNDAAIFCNRLSQKTGRTYRLPSEAEWEYTCRAGATTPFYFGETIASYLANYYGAGRKQTIEVGSFPPNFFGLYDMHGNVWEWCQDTWHKNYQAAPTDGSAWTSGNIGSRLLRGGSWAFNPTYCRSANRFRNSSDNWLNVYGFRVVLVARIP